MEQAEVHDDARRPASGVVADEDRIDVVAEPARELGEIRSRVEPVVGDEALVREQRVEDALLEALPFVLVSIEQAPLEGDAFRDTKLALPPSTATAPARFQRTVFSSQSTSVPRATMS